MTEGCLLVVGLWIDYFRELDTIARQSQNSGYCDTVPKKCVSPNNAIFVKL